MPDVGAFLSFRTGEPSIFIRRSSLALSEGDQSIQFEIELNESKAIKSSSGKNLSTRSWTLAVSPNAEFNDFASSMGGIGVFISRGNISAALGRASFQRLLDCINSGRVPRSVEVEVIGMNYEDDGSISFIADGREDEIGVVSNISFQLGATKPLQAYTVVEELRRVRVTLYSISMILVLVALKLLLSK